MTEPTLVVDPPRILTCPTCKGTYFAPVQNIPLSHTGGFLSLQLYFCVFCQSTIEIPSDPSQKPRIFATPHRQSS